MSPRLLATMLAAPLLLTSVRALAADPTTVDCLGANESSLKLGNQHKLRAARSQLLVCAAATCPADIRKECMGRVEEVNAQIPTVVFSAKDAKGGDLMAVKVTMDGEVLAEHLEGTAMSIDPGPHAFTFEVPGQAPVTKTLVIIEGQKDRRELVTIGAPIAPYGATASGPATGTGAPVPPSPEAPPASADGSTKRTLGFVVGGVGLAGIGVGGVLLGLASSLSHRAQQEFSPSNHAAADSDHQAAISDQTMGFVAGGVGVAALAVGVVLVATSYHHGSLSQPSTAGLWLAPRVDRSSGGMSLGGAF